MRLYQGRTSSASWRLRWAFALKRLPYELIWLDIPSGEHRRVLAPLTPLQQLPTLVLDDGTVLGESVAILEWLEETVPKPPLLPKEPLARARVRQLVQLVNAGIHPLQNTRVRRAVSPDDTAQNAWGRRWIHEGLTAFEALARQTHGRFSAGDALSLADLFLVPQARNMERFGGDLSDFPRVRQIVAACMETEEARSTDPRVVAPPLAG
jgi:maleylacetoacetate isomerase